MPGSIGVRRPRRRSMFLAALAGWLLIAAPSASAAVSCNWFDPAGDVPRITVNYDASGDVVSIVRSENLIHVNGASCIEQGGTTEGTVTNTDYVAIAPDQPTGNVQTTISLKGGEFEPGHDGPDVAEPNEIFFRVHLDPPSSPSFGDVLRIVGGGGAEDVRFGRRNTDNFRWHAINLDAAEDLDVDISDFLEGPTDRAGTADLFRFVGAAGADRAGGRGDGGTGGVFDARLRLSGQTGADLLIGGDHRDTLIGGDAADTLRGSRRRDMLKGSAGNDVLRGGWGPDLLVGGPGWDTCRGGPGTDILRSCEA
jgi:Ca2+-binding RTX toxin-like protein